MNNYKSKQMVIDALIKVVNAAPNSQMQTSYYYASNQPHPISHQDYVTWLNYANSILDISYNHTGLNDFLSTKINISQISFQNNVPYEQQIDRIKHELLNLAQRIL